MHPDDQAPPTPPRRKHRFPHGTLSILVGCFGALMVAVAGVSTFSERWWAIVIICGLIWTMVQTFVRLVLRWAMERSGMHVVIVVSDKSDDPSI